MENGGYDIFVGTYTDSMESGGIYRICVDSSGCIKNSELAASSRNPSYLCMKGQILCAVSEYEKGGTVTGYKIGEQQCSELWQTVLNSAGLCHAFYSQVYDFILLSGYLGGDYSCINALDGSILSHIIHEPCNSAQPHAHCAVTDHNSKFILCADLGLDTVSSYEITGGKPAVTPSSVYNCKKGSGPRQLVFHPHMNVLYAANELDNTVSSFMYDPSRGELSLLQNIPASGAGNHGINHPAGITTTSDGSMLYVSNRGIDTIAAFQVLSTGLIKCTGEFPCGGRFPRHIMLTADDRFLVISNQKSNNIAVCPVDRFSGSIGSSTAYLDIPTPSCTVEYIRQ